MIFHNHGAAIEISNRARFRKHSENLHFYGSLGCRGMNKVFSIETFQTVSSSWCVGGKRLERKKEVGFILEQSLL